jgi:hypothetical protein
VFCAAALPKNRLLTLARNLRIHSLSVAEYFREEKIMPAKKPSTHTKKLTRGKKIRAKKPLMKMMAG